MKITIDALKGLYTQLGGSLTDTYSAIADGIPVADYTTIPDCIEAVTQKASSGGEKFIITLSQDDDTIVADKTKAEIDAAHAAGKELYVNVIPLEYGSETPEGALTLLPLATYVPEILYQFSVAIGDTVYCVNYSSEQWVREIAKALPEPTAGSVGQVPMVEENHGELVYSLQKVAQGVAFAITESGGTYSATAGTGTTYAKVSAMVGANPLTYATITMPDGDTVNAQFGTIGTNIYGAEFVKYDATASKFNAYKLTINSTDTVAVVACTLANAT